MADGAFGAIMVCKAIGNPIKPSIMMALNVTDWENNPFCPNQLHLTAISGECYDEKEERCFNTQDNTSSIALHVVLIEGLHPFSINSNSTSLKEWDFNRKGIVDEKNNHDVINRSRLPTTWAAGIDIDDAWARETVTGMSMGGVFMEIENDGTQEDRLIGGSSPIEQ